MCKMIQSGVVDRPRGRPSADHDSYHSPSLSRASCPRNPTDSLRFSCNALNLLTSIYPCCLISSALCRCCNIFLFGNAGSTLSVVHPMASSTIGKVPTWREYISYYNITWLFTHPQRREDALLQENAHYRLSIGIKVFLHISVIYLSKNAKGKGEAWVE